MSAAKKQAAAADTAPAAITLIEAITQALAYEMRNDESVVVLGEDVGVNGGVFRATAGLSQTFGTQRVLDTPLDETTIAGLTVGMASQGIKPGAEAQFAGFLYPVVHFIVCPAPAYEMRNDESVVVPGEDVGVNGGVFRATAGLSQTFGTQRVLDTPLDETTIAGLTVGMASQGMKPVAEAQFDGFMYPMVDFIVCHAARMRYRTRGRLTCPMVLRVPWGGGIRAPEHHSEANESIFTNVPGLRVVLPSSPARAYGLLLAAIRDPDPVIFMEPKRIYRQCKEVVADDGEALPLDVCYVLRDGTDLTLVTWGAQVKETLEAAEKLAGEGISAEVIDVATLKPLDFDTIAESVARTGRCVIVHEAAKTAGFGAEIAARLAEESMFDLVAPVERVTGYDTHIPLFRLEMKYLPSVDKIVAAAKRVIAAG